MTINVRQKGQEGEREIAKILNGIVANVRHEFELPQYETRDELFQRNQNQTAVGGSDLSNPLYLDIEVKRQEQLSVGTWWKQTMDAAKRSSGIPILIYRQNRKLWRVCMLVDIPLQPVETLRYGALSGVRGEIEFEDFKQWFAAYYRLWLEANTGPK
jgi:hypothetical protein